MANKHLDFRRFSFSKSLADDEFMSMCKSHWNEFVCDKEHMPFLIDSGLYEVLEVSGNSVSMGAYDGDEIVGYMVGVLSNHPHHSTTKVLNVDAFFLEPSYRSGRNGLRFIKESEREAIKEGADFIIWNARPGTALAKLLHRLGVPLVSVSFAKRLSDAI